VLHVQQELLTFRSTCVQPPLSGVPVTRSLVLCVIFCISLFVPLSFFCHWAVCPSLIYGFWSPLWCLQTCLYRWYASCFASCCGDIAEYKQYTYIVKKCDIISILFRKVSVFMFSRRYNNVSILFIKCQFHVFMSSCFPGDKIMFVCYLLRICSLFIFVVFSGDAITILLAC